MPDSTFNPSIGADTQAAIDAWRVGHSFLQPFNTTTENEPGINNFRINNFPEILILLEDPYWGITPNSAEVGTRLLSVGEYADQLRALGVWDLFDNRIMFEDQLYHGVVSPEMNQFMAILLDPANQVIFNNALLIFPRLARIIDAWSALVRYQAEVLAEQFPEEDSVTETYMDAFGDGLESVVGYQTTGDLIQKWFKERDDVAPAAVNSWEMRVGASKFYVPPTSIKVSKGYRTGSLTGGALRQQNSPKFNSGHSETVIEMTLYFPNHEAIWGIGDASELTIDFENDDEATIDRFVSSLRGLITQFKYAPFLPVRNEYLNRTWGITGVALHSMSISTVPGFPFCVAVNLEMLNFNHKIYLPPVNDFNQAIHWGRYRQYIGRAAQKISSMAREGFLVEEVTESDDARLGTDDQGGIPGDLLPEKPEETTVIKYESEPTIEFSRSRDLMDGKNFDLYFPKRTPARTFAPDTAGFRQSGEDRDVQKDKNAWEIFLGYLGFDADTNPTSYYDEVENNSQGFVSNPTEREKLLAYLEHINATAEAMNDGRLEEYIQQRLAENPDITGAAADELRLEIETMWFNAIFTGWRLTPFFQKYLEGAEFIDGQYLIREWKVPMEKMYVNWKNVIIQGVSVNMANNIVRLQVQMQEEPAHQHIGGRDSQVSVSMVVFGEDDLIRFRRVFEHINNLARLEQAHGVLGFLGVKNVLTALAGIKYVLPLNFEVSTEEGYPHVYRVNMTFVDFDIFQQQREELSSAQQQQLIEAFGKRNPFLRIKQLWGAFNAYPDFPLAVRDDAGNVVGHLDPDFYFRGYQMFDDDVVYWGLEGGELPNKNTGENSADNLRSFFGGISDTITDAVADQDAREAATTDDPTMPGVTPATGQEVDARPRQSYGGLTFSNQSLQSSLTKHEHQVNWTFGLFSEDQNEVSVASLKKNGELRFGKVSAQGTPLSTPDEPLKLRESTLPENSLFRPSVEGLSAYASYQNALADGTDNPAKHYEMMMTDTQYRDISGRMIRAFPTYMLWLIDEGGRFAGVKLFDNFYGLQSVIDFSLVQSEDILGDTLVLRLSNIYQRLTTPYKNYMMREQGSDFAPGNNDFIDVLQDRQRNLESGANDNYLVELDSIRLKPGVRLHLRMGYSSNPNTLRTVFNGTITEVRAGDIVEVVAQSDAIELSPYINTTNKKGHSGKIDGAFNTGLWLSEPRDLMVRLLSMGSSTFKESIAHATNGTIFSENKFGIRHFGQILYEPLNVQEQNRHDQRFNVIKSTMDRIVNTDPTSATDITATAANAVGNPLGSLAGGLGNVSTGGYFDSALGGASTRTPMIAVMQSMWTNFFRKRDYEIFKRNIYPGNGLGIAQFLGGDSLDGGLTAAQAANFQGDPNTATANNARTPTPGDTQGLIFAASAAQSLQDAQNIVAIDNLPAGQQDAAREAVQGDAQSSAGIPGHNGSTGGAIVGGTLGGPLGAIIGGQIPSVLAGNNDNPILQALGISGDDTDLDGFDEVSFRAQTYMKSVWDLFKLCAALLPNYIVAVRPFEDRSTVFYGKPHWLYTSGVTPISTGVPKSEGPDLEGPDEEFQRLLNEASQTANAFADATQQKEWFTSVNNTDPYTSGAGMAWTGGNINDLPLIHENGATIPMRSTGMGMEMHLPTSGDINEDIAQHLQTAEVRNSEYAHPGYMDPAGGARGGVSGFMSELERQQSDAAAGNARAGQNGAFGYLSPDIEQWYMNMRWPYVDGVGSQRDYLGKRVLVMNEVTHMACVCAIGEYGPSGRVEAGGIGAGCSPDVAFALGMFRDGAMQRGDRCSFGFVPDSTRLGPTSGAGAYGGNGGITGTTTNINPTTTTDANGNSTSRGPIYYEEFTELGLPASMTTSILSGIEITESDIEDIDVALFGTFLEEAGAFTPESIRQAALSDKDLTIYAYEYGFLDKDVPVWIAPKRDQIASETDQVGIAARLLYDKEYAQWVASATADPNAPTPVADAQATVDVSTEFLDHSGAGPAGGRNLQQANRIWNEFRSGSDTGFMGFDETKLSLLEWQNGLLQNEDGTLNIGPVAAGGDPVVSVDDISITVEDAGSRIIASFMRFMWQTAYARAWLIMTTSRHHDWTDIADGDVASLTPNNTPDPTVDVAIDVVDFVAGSIPLDFDNPLGDDDQWNFGESSVRDLFRQFLVTYNPEVFDERDAASGEYTSAALGNREVLLNWMRANNKQGIDSAGVLDRTLENLKDTFDQTIGRVWKAISTGLSGLVSLYRLSMMQLGNGLENVHAMQRQANVLNKVFNDSIYYAAGEPGSILRLADNPFTREYGEPVIEIREPFQRIHYISSWQHILSNNITENLNGVATIVTATSDGEYPVSVYFDKGAPPERQTETAVETGLFWDNARGSGFFGFLHPLLHPIETARGIIKNSTGSSDELTSKRVALYHLKEGLKDIYTGEITVMGNPDIRPHDLLYIADVYSRIYGLCEVEQVVHHFTPETGFISSITPNALVTINDPGRWAMTSWVNSWLAVKNMRDDVRLMLQQKGHDSSPLANANGVSIPELAESLETQFKGHIQFAHGNSALIRDLAAASTMGELSALAGVTGQGGVSGGDLANNMANLIPGVSLIKDLVSIPWNWVKDNLVDQHGCYIQYLNKDGQPMDSGLSYNQGVAVGQHHSMTVLPGILGLDVDIFRDGHKRITSNDLLAALGWTEIDIESVQREISWWVAQTNAQILEASGRSPDELPFKKPTVEIVTVDYVRDGDTFVDTSGQAWRMAGVDAAEILHNFNAESGTIPVDETSIMSHMGYLAAAYLHKRLIDDPVSMGHEPTVAVREAVGQNTYDRKVGVMFHNVPEGTDPEGRDAALQALAEQWPIIEWDSYMDDGRPYTINWEMISSGYAQVFLFGNQFDTDRGALGLGRQ